MEVAWRARAAGGWRGPGGRFPGLRGRSSGWSRGTRVSGLSVEPTTMVEWATVTSAGIRPAHRRRVVAAAPAATQRRHFAGRSPTLRPSLSMNSARCSPSCQFSGQALPRSAWISSMRSKTPGVRGRWVALVTRRGARQPVGLVQLQPARPPVAGRPLPGCLVETLAIAPTGHCGPDLCFVRGPGCRPPLSNQLGTALSRLAATRISRPQEAVYGHELVAPGPQA